MGTDRRADDPAGLVATLLDPVPPGSFLALTHPARDQLTIAVKAEQSLTRSMGRHADSVLDFSSAPTAMWGLVARKP